MSKIIKHLKFFITAIFIAVLMALLEVQIEGSVGWATNLPTWRFSSINIFGLIGYISKPITGYHVYLWTYSFLLLHISFFFSKWSMKKEFYLISFYIFFTTFEGIIWFIINPAFGLSKLVNKEVDWYQEPYILYLPIEYWLRFILGFVFYKLSNGYKTNKK